MNQTVGPRFCVDEKGDVIVDSNSLIKSQQFEVNEEVQEDDFFGWSPSYPKIKRMTSPKWMHSEDELFFSVGSDFDLMHQFFPSRSRDQLKLKFKKEEKKERTASQRSTGKTISSEQASDQQDGANADGANSQRASRAKVQTSQTVISSIVNYFYE
ncbi:Transcription factor TFIIIB component B''-like protein [Aphelenchoides besseyi]|nr:Transcription factor TFIIIB component B''-like protein [Aphelenchoides besseyi]